MAPPQAIILAAGKGKRMQADVPKVLLEVADRPMIWWVVQACFEAEVRRCIIVVGSQSDGIRRALADQSGCAYVQQLQPKGTAHATRAAEPLFANQPPADLFILAADGPLIRAETLMRLHAAHRAHSAVATLATAVLADPSGYGRVVRDQDGQFSAIVEEKDASGPQRLIHEVNPSYYCFRSDSLFEALGRVDRSNRQGEYYLTDVPALLKAEGQPVCVVDNVPPEDVLSINTPQQLHEVDQILRHRLTAATR